MKAVCFNETLKVSVADVEKPVLVEDTDAIIKVKYSAICGSDLHPYRGAEKGIAKGTIMGHEFVGEIEQIGNAVKNFAVGDMAVAPFTTSCGDCYFCKNKMSCRCVKGQLFGWIDENTGNGIHGGQAQFVRVPMADSTLVRVPERLPKLEQALLLGDILSTGFFCALQAGLAQNRDPSDSPKTAVVVGCGPVGLMAVAAAKSLLNHDGDQVFAIDCVPERLQVAKSFGATKVFNFKTTKDIATLIKSSTPSNLGADFALEVVGQPSALKTAYNVLRPGGTLSSVGVHAYESFPISPAEFYDKNLTFRSGRCPARTIMSEHLDKLCEILDGIDLDQFFTHKIKVDEVSDFYVKFNEQRDGVIKILIDFQ